jgi:hypothetical protein
MGGLARYDDARQEAAGTNPVAQSFLACLTRAQHETWPFDYWLLDKAIPDADVDAITALPFAPPPAAVFDGRRETNNATRVYFTRENQERFGVCRDIVRGFNDPAVRRSIEQTTGADLTDARLRIEYCQDEPGFWLEPHTDILVKKFTMLVYLSDDPRLRMAGTDIHEGPPDYKYVCTAPYGRNLGVIFIPGKTSWHAVGHHPIVAGRKSIIINYVSPEWRDTWELA